jgi:TatD DNase family protein
VIDTHAHLEACAGPTNEVVERARVAGVTRILAVGSTIETCRAALATVEANEGVFAILGVHPHEAAAEGDRLDELAELLGHPRSVAVGETGLDFYRDRSPRNRQREVFDAELDLARDLGKPVVIHTRAAEAETVRTLERFTGTVVLHCFSSPALLPVALERGYYVSFAGNVTYPNAFELRVAATQVPVDRLLAETDSPYLAPQPFRGRPNEPANVMHTLTALAEARGEDGAELEARIDANAAAAFALP